MKAKPLTLTQRMDAFDLRLAAMCSELRREGESREMFDNALKDAIERKGNAHHITRAECYTTAKMLRAEWDNNFRNLNFFARMGWLFFGGIPWY